MSGDQMPSAALPRIMRAVQVDASGGGEQLHLSSIPVPTPLTPVGGGCSRAGQCHT
jgi:hypothetical protein